MIRSFLLGVTLVTSSAAVAAVGPPIAYSIGRDVYLVNQDGSGKQLVYRGATRTSIFSISMKKDGGEMSFEEVVSNGQAAKLITIRYGATGAGTVVRSVPGCRFSVSTRDDGAILAADFCTGAVNYAATATDALTPVAIGRPASKVAWMADGSFLYASQGTIWQATMASPGGIAIRTQDCVQDLAPAHAAGEALVAVGQICDGPRIDRMLVPTGTTERLAAGTDSGYSSDDRCFIFVPPRSRRGTSLLIARVDGTGSSVQLGNNANYNSVDWRADSQPATCRLVATDALQFRTVP